MEVLEVDDNICKSPRDDRHYKYLKLANGLKALVVSDESTEKAAAALSVRVGYLCDPETVPGLAHFCEHMAFLGTDKYPSENDYMEFLSHHGGSSNAMTAMEFTTFYFDVAADHLMGALDRFSQFFISPLFTVDATDREINAVDSENDKNLQEDSWRFRQVCHETSDPSHPYRRFGTGNKYTLKTRPLELGVDVREELLNFHSKYYSSNLMTLAVVGKEPLEELTATVRGLFSPIVDKCVPVPSYPNHPYTANELQTWIEYVPVKDVRQVILQFPLPDIMEHYRSHPSLYIAHLVGHEGAGSLLSFLKSKHWCNTLLAGPEMGAKGFMFFSASMDLTEEGMELVEEVVTATFQYLSMLRNMEPQKWVHEECANLNALSFRFKEKEKPRPYVKELTQNLHHYAPCDVLTGDYLVREFRPDLIKQLLGHLRPQTCRVVVIGQKFKGTTTQKEPWYGSDYNIRKIDPKLIEKWSEVERNESLFLPTPNEFIPTDFSLVPPPQADAPKVPVLIQDTAMTKVWYKQDDTFFTPKVCIKLKISSPMVYESPATCCMTSLFISLLCDALNEYAYDAELAGIGYRIIGTVYSLDIGLSGYHHKQSILLRKIVEKMSQFTVDPKRFDVFKELLTRQLHNFRAEQPYSHAVYYGDVLLDNMAWTKEEMAKALVGVHVDEFQEFVLHSFFSKVHIEALVHGNITKEGCLDIVSMVENTLKTKANSKPLPSPLPLHRQVQLPERSAYLYQTENEVHNCCCADLYFQTGVNSTSSNMLLQLLAHTLKEPCFDKLRTKEQLGYIVASGLRRSHGVQGLRILIQSDKPAVFVEKRVEAFLRSFQEVLKTMTNETFEKHKAALAVERSVKPKTLNEECSRYWSELQRSEYHFKRDEEEVEYLMTITQEQLCQFFDEFIAGNGGQRRKLSVHVLPVEGQSSCSCEEEKPAIDANEVKNDETSDTTETTDGPITEETDSGDTAVVVEPIVIKCFSSFKSGLSLYPQVRPYISTSL